MSKYCLICKQEKDWENPLIEGEPLLCSTCSTRITKSLEKLMVIKKERR